MEGFLLKLGTGSQKRQNKASFLLPLPLPVPGAAALSLFNSLLEQKACEPIRT
jgi:hypothetical protein